MNTHTYTNDIKERMHLPTVDGGTALVSRINKGESIERIYAYIGPIYPFPFEQEPSVSDDKTSVLTLPEGISPTEVFWPVEGFEIFASINGYCRDIVIRLLVSELFSSGANRVSTFARNYQGVTKNNVYARQGVEQ